MAIGTNNELRTAVANWLGKANLTARIPEFIAFAEKRLDRVFAKRAAGAEVVVTTIDTTAEVVDLPADFLAMRLFVLDGAYQRVLTYKTPERLYLDFPSVATLQPDHYTLRGKGDATGTIQIQFRPLPDATYEGICWYYKKITALAPGGGTDTNWMLVNAPDAYLYATLIEAAPYLKDAADLETWSALLKRSIDDLVDLDEAQRWNSTLVQRPGVRWMRGM